ncbi:MAG: hypothetical protein SPL02_00955 [Bacilli bacterium]|nr:hypothetical protein [Bacilli bacterium]
MKFARGIFLVASALFITSCSSYKGGASFYQYGELNTSELVEETKQGYIENYSFKSIKSKDKTYSSFSEVFQSSGSGTKVAHINLPSTGDQKLLVIPVEFSDYKAEDHLPNNALDLINNAFIGTDESNSYNSVGAFYARSSNDRLHLHCQVASKWFTPTYTYKELKATTSLTQNKGILINIYNQAVSWYKENFDDYKDLTFKGIDDKDYLPIYFVYSAPYSGSDGSRQDKNSMMWAFTINYPAPIAWSSFDMLHVSNGKTDAHTFIHETGHLFGLKDYYDTTTRSDEAYVSALGRVDMMDCSLGDHCSFSKLLLGWTKPFLVTGESNIVLHPFEGNNEFILLPSPSYNGSMFDEYLLLEFYTPTYLNYADAILRGDKTTKLFEEYGIKIFHVDARLGIYKGSSGIMQKLLTESDLTADARVDVAYDNNLVRSGSSINTSKCLIQLLSAGTRSSKLVPYFVASDKNEDYETENVTLALRRTLFKLDEGINENMLSDFRWHKNNSPLSYNINIGRISATTATINFTNK